MEAKLQTKKKTKNHNFTVNKSGYSPGKGKKGTTMNPLTQFKKISILLLLIALALFALASPTVARADAVTDWNAIASTAIVTDGRAAAAGVGAELRDGAGGGI